MGAVLREIIIDCTDPVRVAEFWSQVLGWKVQETQDGARWMSGSGAPFPDLLLVFDSVPERKSVKNRIHLDVSPVGCERDEEVERLIGFGATRVDIGASRTK
jgi:hypothetical protein